MRFRLIAVAASVGLLSALGCSKTTTRERMPARAYPSSVDASFLGSLEWRPIGPPRAGRAPTVAGDPQKPVMSHNWIEPNPR
jgi:hypothetical protein